VKHVEATRASTKLPLIAAFVSMSSWGAGPLVIRGISASTSTITVMRLALSVPVMMWWARRTGGRLDWRVMKATALPGVFFFSSMALAFEAIRHTSIANQTLIGSLSPALLLFVAPRLLGERVIPAQVIAVLIGFLGIGLVVFGGGDFESGSLFGDSLSFVSMVLWTTYVVMVKRVRVRDENGWAYLAGNFAWSAIYGIPWAIFGSFSLSALGGVDWTLLLVMVVVQGTLAHGLHAWSLRHIDATVSSLINLGAPVFSVLGAWWIYGQHMTLAQVFGAFLVLGSLGIVSLTTSRRDSPVSL
jgi:drug/metabolite transporter (DMT)-like permease